MVLGGDGFMLQTLHEMLNRGKVIPAYGLNRGTVGFMMNRYRNGGSVLSRVQKARPFTFSPLRMEAITQDGKEHTFLAINEVSLLREMRQTAKIEVSVNGRVRIKELVCDGVLLSTPAGSTAYNLSANGPILPLDSKLLALTPISPFRPRRWKGALLPHTSVITMENLDPEKRPLVTTADFRDIFNVVSVTVREDQSHSVQMLFDKDHSLEERIIREQFTA